MSGVFIGLGITAIGTGFSFAQAGSQRKKYKAAEAAAAESMEAARKRLEVNYLEQLAIDKEAYEEMREAALVSGAQTSEALAESERGVAAGAGRLGANMTAAQEGITTAQRAESLALDKAVAKEDSRLRDVNVQLDLGEVAGAQQAITDAKAAETAALQQGFQGLANLGAGAVSATKLYGKSEGAKAFDKAQGASVRQAKKDYMQGAGQGKGFLGIGTGFRKSGARDIAADSFIQQQVGAIDFGTTGMENFVAAGMQGEKVIGAETFDPTAILGMSAAEFKAYMNTLSPAQRNMINTQLGLYDDGSDTSLLGF